MQGELPTALLSISSLTRLSCVGALWGDSVPSPIFLAEDGRGGGGGGDGPCTGSFLALKESGPGWEENKCVIKRQGFIQTKIISSYSRCKGALLI